MNKSQLIDALAARYEGNRKAAAHALESVLDTITREVAKGEKVAITGFGSFEKRVREARWVRNPRTGERMKAKKTAVPKFTAGADLKAVVSGAKKLPKLTARRRQEGRAPAKKAAAKGLPTAKKAARQEECRQEGAGRAGEEDRRPRRRQYRQEGAAPAKKTTGQEGREVPPRRRGGADEERRTAKKVPVRRRRSQRREEGTGHEGAAKKAPRRRRRQEGAQKTRGRTAQVGSRTEVRRPYPSRARRLSGSASWGGRSARGAPAHGGVRGRRPNIIAPPPSPRRVHVHGAGEGSDAGERHPAAVDVGVRGEPARIAGRTARPARRTSWCRCRAASATNARPSARPFAGRTRGPKECGAGRSARGPRRRTGPAPRAAAAAGRRLRSGRRVALVGEVAHVVPRRAKVASAPWSVTTMTGHAGRA